MSLVRDGILSELHWMMRMSPFQYVCTHFLLHYEYRLTTTHQFLEVQAQHAFIRDEQSKGRWDAALTRSLFGFMMEVFERTVGNDLGPRVNDGGEAEHVC